MVALELINNCIKLFMFPDNTSVNVAKHFLEMNDLSYW